MTRTKAESLHRLYSALESLGFTFDEAQQLRRIEMTLHRWAELECGDGNDFASWAIERDETTDKPYLVTHPHDGKGYRRAIPDREKGALKRLAAIVKARNDRHFAPNTSANGVENLPQFVIAYQQTDPRGCALYIVRKADVPAGESVSAFYTRGVAVAA